MTEVCTGDTMGDIARGELRTDGRPIARAEGLLSLAAAPAFLTMALLAGVGAGGMPDGLCSAARDASPLSGMVPMYLLMSAFHLAPWLRLVSALR
jgi:hypothetical protein